MNVDGFHKIIGYIALINIFANDLMIEISVKSSCIVGFRIKDSGIYVNDVLDLEGTQGILKKWGCDISNL